MKFSGRTWRPPHERLTPIIEATTGCAWGRCAFCNMYREEAFGVGSLERFERELDEIKSLIPYTRRLWLTGGSPFQMSFAQLEERALAVRDRLIKCASIAMFASVRDIDAKTDAELRRLRSLQINGLTVGIESGSDEALRLARKGYTSNEARRQLARLDAAGIEYNVTFITGLLGSGRGRWHAHVTAELLNSLNPGIIVVSALTAFPGTPLQRCVDEGRFVPASRIELLEELRALVEELSIRTCLDTRTVSNPLPLLGMLPYERHPLLARIEHAIEACRHQVMPEGKSRTRPTSGGV
ncbi:MAG: radical SAM protein [Coriobacteriales bacterium]